MANETKAIMASVIPKERPYTTATPHFCIPVAEAWEFLKLVIRAVGLVKEPIFSQRLARDRALEYQAKLPKEEK